jgi:DNA-binding transcriptional MerR regulator
MRIGELAEAVGVSTRTVRHYHRVGLLPEPPRQANGYRIYGLRDALRLARARRLVELGLSLDEAADVLQDDEGRELAEILAELDADLSRQEAAIRAQRERLAVLLRRGGPGVDDTVSTPMAELLDEMQAAFPGSTTAQLDREFLALVDRGEATEDTVALYRAALDDPEQRSRAAELYRRFDELTGATVDDARIPDLARDLAAALPPELAAQVDPDSSIDAHPLGAAILRDLSPAQAEVMRSAQRLVTTAGSPDAPGTRP